MIIGRDDVNDFIYITNIIYYYIKRIKYTLQEVADRIDCSRKTVESYLHKFKEETKESGINETFWSYFSMNSLLEIICNKNCLKKKEQI